MSIPIIPNLYYTYNYLLGFSGSDCGGFTVHIFLAMTFHMIKRECTCTGLGEG